MGGTNFKQGFGFFLLILFSACSSRPDAPPLKPIEKAQKEGKKYVIASQGEASTEIAEEVLARGGNLIDAFVALSFAISVERPQSTGLGGGGFLLYRHGATGRVFALDFREQAPRKASLDMYIDKDGKARTDWSQNGALAVGTPGMVAGLLKAHRLFGKLGMGKILKGPIELARNGFPVYRELHEALLEKKEILQKDSQAREIFFDAQGKPLAVGAILKQENLAKTLEKIRQHGSSGFYYGSVAKALVQQQKDLGGLIRHSDLRRYKVKQRRPVEGSFLGHQIYSMPPPSSGGAHVIQILNVLEEKKIASLDPENPQAIHYMASAMQQAFADRSLHMGDSDFVKVPLKKLVSKDYARAIARSIPEDGSSIRKPSSDFKFVESNETTHFSMMNIQGDMIASTQTINGWFGAKIMIPDAGVFLNNEMDDFSIKPGEPNLFGAIGGKANAVAPRKRPLSSMSPTIVLKGKSPVLALGSPSGTRIISCVAQTLVNRLAYKKSLYESMLQRRFHHQWSPDQIDVEQPGFSRSQERALASLGYKVNEKDLGCKVQAVEKLGDRLVGVSDPRGYGSVAAE